MINNLSDYMFDMSRHNYFEYEIPEGPIVVIIQMQMPRTFPSFRK